MKLGLGLTSIAMAGYFIGPFIDPVTTCEVMAPYAKALCTGAAFQTGKIAVRSMTGEARLFWYMMGFDPAIPDDMDATSLSSF
jgi:hypothetical protein